MSAIDAGKAAEKCPSSCDYAGNCIPLLYVLGAQKAGTTAIWSLIDSTRQTCGAISSSLFATMTQKETHFLTNKWPERGSPRRDFASLYTTTSCPVGCFVEGTPSNIRDREAPSRLYGILTPDERVRVRFVVILREPLSRDLSWYNHNRANWYKAWGTNSVDHESYNVSYSKYAAGNMKAWLQCTKAKGFSAFAVSIRIYQQCGFVYTEEEHKGGGILSAGMYWAQLQLWWRKFDRQQMLILISDEISEAPLDFQRKLYRHVGIHASALPAVPHANTKNYPGKVGLMDCRTRDALQDLYSGWNKRLFHDLKGELLGNRSSFSLPSCR